MSTVSPTPSTLPPALKPELPVRQRRLVTLIAFISLCALLVIFWGYESLMEIVRRSYRSPQVQRPIPKWLYEMIYVVPTIGKNGTALQFGNATEAAIIERDTSRVIDHIRHIQAEANEEQKAFDFGSVQSIEPKSGFAIDKFPDSRDWNKFQLIKEPQNPIWLNAAARVPFFSKNKTRAAFLDVVTNAFFWKHGSAYNARTATAYEIGGGCCSGSWEWRIDDTANIDRWARESFEDNGNQTVLVLAQHHGESYHHVLFENAPRYLTVLPIVEALPEMKVVIDDSDLSEYMLIFLGLDPRRIIRIGRESPFHFARVLLYPPVVFQNMGRRYFDITRVERAVALLLKAQALRFGPGRLRRTVDTLRRIPYSDAKDADLEAVLAKLERQIPRDPRQRPVIIMLERAVSRRFNGNCRDHRCMGNFQALHTEVMARHGGRYEVKVYPARATPDEAIPMFDSASIVVGMHGGGFQNLMFCRPGTDVIHIGWGLHYKGTALNFGLRYHLYEMENINRESTNIMVNVTGIAEVLDEIVERRKEIDFGRSNVKE